MVSLFWSAWKKLSPLIFSLSSCQFFSISLFPNCLFFVSSFHLYLFFLFSPFFSFLFFLHFFILVMGSMVIGDCETCAQTFKQQNADVRMFHETSVGRALRLHWELKAPLSILQSRLHGAPSVQHKFQAPRRTASRAPPKYEWIASRSDWTPSLSELNSVNVRSRPSASLILYSTSFSFFAFSISFSFDSRSNVTAALSSAAVIPRKIFWKIRLNYLEQSNDSSALTCSCVRCVGSSVVVA